MRPISTPLSRRLGLRYPLVAAPMFIISNREMLVACAEAGILGAMPSLNARTAEDFEETLRWVRARTDKPFAINVTIGLTKPERLERDVALCLEYEVPVMITSYGDPTRIVEAAHTKGITVFHDVIHRHHFLAIPDTGGLTQKRADIPARLSSVLDRSRLVHRAVGLVLSNDCAVQLDRN